jgi:hypothetical protein
LVASALGGSQAETSFFWMPLLGSFNFVAYGDSPAATAIQKTTTIHLVYRPLRKAAILRAMGVPPLESLQQAE